MFPGKEACHRLTFRKANNIHAWKPKKHDFVLADLALVNLLVNGASGKEPGHINPCWLMFAYLHTHMLTEFTYTCQPDPVWKNQSVLSTPLGCFTCSTWTVSFRVLPCLTRPCGTCRCSRASFVRHATPGPSPASPWRPRKNATRGAEGLVWKCQHHSITTLPEISTSKNSYQLQYDPTCPTICSKL